MPQIQKFCHQSRKRRSNLTNRKNGNALDSFYDVINDCVEKRAQFRELHLKHARAAYDRGELVLGGALADPVDGAVLVFRGDSAELVEKFAQADPYVWNGLVKQRHVRKWNTVIGDGATGVS